MLTSNDVIWETERVHAEQPYTDKAMKNKTPQGKNGRNTMHAAKTKTRRSFSATRSFSLLGSNEAKGTVGSTESDASIGVTLKDLNPHDKQKIAQLIKELAKVGEEKDSIASTLSDERGKFLTCVRQLEDEKNLLMNQQKFLSEEVRQCQTLLQYYQDLITMQQTSLTAHKAQRRQRDSASVTTVDECCKDSSCHEAMDGSLADENLSSQSDHIKAEEIYSGDTEAVSSSFTDDEVLRMSDRRYRAYLRKKKDKLKREQENLRKLLSMKATHNSDLTPLDEIEISPVRDEVADLQGTPASKATRRSMPVQARSPVNERTLPYLSPLGTMNRESPRKSHSSHSSETLKRSTSSEQILHLLAQDATEDVIRSTLRYSMTEPSESHRYDLSTSANEGGIATNVMNCEDSQILQDIFFV